MKREWKRHIWIYEPLDQPGVVRTQYDTEGPFLCNKYHAHVAVIVREGDGIDRDGCRLKKITPLKTRRWLLAELYFFTFGMASGVALCLAILRLCGR